MHQYMRQMGPLTWKKKRKMRDGYTVGCLDLLLTPITLARQLFCIYALSLKGGLSFRPVL